MDFELHFTLHVELSVELADFEPYDGRYVGSRIDRLMECEPYASHRAARRAQGLSGPRAVRRIAHRAH